MNERYNKRASKQISNEQESKQTQFTMILIYLVDVSVFISYSETILGFSPIDFAQSHFRTTAKCNFSLHFISG